MTWRRGNSAGEVVSDDPVGERLRPEIEKAYGAPYLVCETVATEATMRLIIAAPEMLAALKALVDDHLDYDEDVPRVLGSDRHCIHCQMPEGHGHELECTVRQALEAIEKAEVAS